MRLVRCTGADAACWAAVGCSDAPPSPNREPEDVPPWQVTLEQDADTANADVTLRINTSHRVVVRGVRISWSGYADGGWQPADRWRDCRRNHGGWECIGLPSIDLPFDEGATTHEIDVMLLALVCEEDPADPVSHIGRDHLGAGDPSAADAPATTIVAERGVRAGGVRWP